jgi:hypothetical protein
MFAGSAGLPSPIRPLGRASIARRYPIDFANEVEREVRVAVVGEPVGLIGHRFQNPCDGMRNARLKREDAFSHAMIIVTSAMVSSS